MAQREVGIMELLQLMVETVGHRRMMVMLGAALICGVHGAKEWPEVINALRWAGYSLPTVYALRADFQKVALVVEQAEGEPVPWESLMRRCRGEACAAFVYDNP